MTVFEKFLNEFPNSPYAEKVSNYLVEVYMNTRSYDAALKSIDRISHPSKAILEAKQKILFQLGTQSFANTQFEQAIGYFNQSVTLGQYNLQTKADALYWLGESYYRLNRMREAARNFNEYLSLTRQRDTEMFALAYYNLGYIAFHQKDYSTAENRFRNFVQLEKGETRPHWQMPTTVSVTATCTSAASTRPSNTIQKQKVWEHLPETTLTISWPL